MAKKEVKRDSKYRAKLKRRTIKAQQFKDGFTVDKDGKRIPKPSMFLQD